ILCNGHQECFQSLFGQDDESFPHCRHLQCIGGTKKDLDCNGKGACIFDGFTTRCFCNEGYYGINCEYYGKNEEKEAFDEFGLEFGKVLSNNKYPNERKNWLKMKEIINEAKEANNKKQKEFGLLIGKGRMEMVEGGGHETSSMKATIGRSEATETTELKNFEATSASSFEARTKVYNTEASSILNPEATSASNSEISTKVYNTEAGPLSTFEANSEATSIKNSEANTRAHTEESFEAISASGSETSTKGYNPETTSILNLETTSASNSMLYTQVYTEAISLSTASNTEAPSIKNSETSSIFNLEASTKASRETASSSRIKATSLETAETTFSNFETKSEANTEATISLNTQINPVATLTVTESTSNKPNNEAILVDNEANFKSKIEAAETEAASLSTIPTKIEETSTKTEYASTKKFSTNEANLLKQMKQKFLTSEAPITEAHIEASSLLSSTANSETNKVFASEAHKTSEAPTTDNPNYASPLSSTFQINSEANLTTMANVSPNSVIKVEATPVLKLATASEANSSSVETTPLANIEATSNNEAKSVSNIETSSEAGIEAEPVAGIEASSGSGIESSSKGSIEATSIKSEIKDTKTSLKGNSLSSNTATPLSNIEASSLTLKFQAKSISTVESSFSNFETTVPFASNSRLNSNKLNTEATSESEAKTKFPFESEAKTKSPFEAEAKLGSSSKAEAEMKSSKFEASTKALFKPLKSEAESPSKTYFLANTSTEATFVANSIKPEALTTISTSFTPQISSLNTRRIFETNFASNNTFSYTEASRINNSETISATTLFSPTEATEPLISVSEANAYINNEATSKPKTEARPSIILVNSASSFKEATSIPKTEAGSTIANLASSASSFNEATSTKPTLTESASTPESVASTYFPSEPETKMERGSRFEASTKSPSEAEVATRKLSTEKPKLSSENSEINLLNTTPFEAITEARNNTNLINNEAASTNIIKTGAETNKNIETNTGSTLEAKFLVSKFEAKSEANTTKSTYPIKSEATSEIYSKNVETITEAALFLANTTNLGVNVAATTSEADSANKREFEQTIPLAGIEATTVANIVATTKPVASIEATYVASNQATSTPVASSGASVARIEAISTPEASIQATLVGSNEAASLAKVNST
uniref:EGF-like domain-containing protein n=1 Tax=Meloidogyne javanica TaxID=6303 RepID=A0A915LTZ0_MELJA